MAKSGIAYKVYNDIKSQEVVGWRVRGGLSISVSTGDNKYGVKYLQHGQLRLGLRRDAMAVYKPTHTDIRASQVNI